MGVINPDLAHDVAFHPPREVHVSYVMYDKALILKYVRETNSCISVYNVEGPFRGSHTARSSI